MDRFSLRSGTFSHSTLLIVYRALVARSRVQPPPVVENFYVLEHRTPDLSLVGQDALSTNSRLSVVRNDSAKVLSGIGYRAHGGHHTRFCEPLAESH